jgi:hypothetical protein
LPRSTRSTKGLIVSNDNNNQDDPFKDFEFPAPSPGGSLPGQNLIQPRPDALYMQDQEESSAVSDQFTSADVNAAVESTALGFNSGFRSKVSLCDTCNHCWSMRKEASVMNLDDNGKPFLAKEAFCTVMPQSLFTLNDRLVQECNKWESGGRARTTLEET